MYRDESCPDPHTMEEGDLFALAEAAEKYDVWSLKRLLRTWMLYVLDSRMNLAYSLELIHYTDL